MFRLALAINTAIAAMLILWTKGLVFIVDMAVESFISQWG